MLQIQLKLDFLQLCSRIFKNYYFITSCKHFWYFITAYQLWRACLHESKSFSNNKIFLNEVILQHKISKLLIYRFPSEKRLNHTKAHGFHDT